MHKISFPEEADPTIAYLCGIFAGDGSLSYRAKKNEYSLKCVGNPKDEKEFYVQVVSTKFEESFGIKPNIRYLDSNTTFGFVMYSKELFNYLTRVIKLPNGVKYDKLRIPKIFLRDKSLLINFIRGVFDTDGCITFKKRYRKYPYYPVISLSSKSKEFIKQIARVLNSLKLKPVEIYDYKVKDLRIEKGFTIINRIELNGKDNLYRFLDEINFSSPKHLNKIKKIIGEV